MAKEQRPLPLQRGMSSLGKAIERPGRRRAARVLPRAVTDARRGAAPGSPVSRRRHQATPLTNRRCVDRSLCV